MNIVYENNLIKSVSNYILDGKTIIFYSNTILDILNNVKHSLDSSKIEYKECEIEQATSDHVEGVINVIAIGPVSVCLSVSRIAQEYIYIPTDSMLEQLQYRIGIDNNPKCCLFDKGLFLSLSDNEYASMVGQIALYSFNELIVDKCEMENKEDIVNSYIKILNNKEQHCIYNQMIKDYCVDNANELGIYMFLFSICLVKFVEFGLNNYQILAFPVDINQKIIIKARRTGNIIEAIKQLEMLGDLNILSYVFKDNIGEYREKIKILSDNYKTYIRNFKKCFNDRGYSIKVNPNKIISHILDYGIYLKPDSLVFQIVLNGMV